MAERKYITGDNLQRFGTNVKLAIKASETTLDGKITNVANIANNGVTAAAGALAEAKKKIAKGALATINGQSLENGGNIELDFTVAEFVTKLPDVATASKSKIYLVASNESGTQNTYAEYIKVTVDGTDKFEKLGEYKAEMDLAPYAKAADLTAHTGNTSNPHGVTKTQVGLGNVDNTSDSTKANTAGNPIHDAIAKKVDATKIAGSTLGLIKAGTTSGKTYGVNVNALTGAATVSVPWTDQNVYQAMLPTSDANAYPILGSAEKSLTDGKAAQSVYLKGLTFTPMGSVLSVGTGEMVAAKFTGALEGNAKTATSAASATKATQDGNGNNIASTYQTQSAFNDFKAEFKDLTPAEIDNLWATAPDTLS
ncbi:hypothetical protein [uncultured Prevotella sp.]|jgi:hypothetical protein|uniref:hypothetical protein n=1 Tax=uncultured Prevotella sp. TaxID=159272 RepID=UPI0027DB8233|nr:hypothetical protein [uncultured Prevotella sp.]